LIPNPIGKVLSTIRKHRVRALLMGGQACILYGAAEFSRDIDLVILADEKNLERLMNALVELHAEPEYFPALGLDVLERGHACHFRVHVREAEGIRLDVMATLRGCDPFSRLWQRRRRIRLPGPGWITLLNVTDLVQAKKTQRDKDWPMIRRLVEVDYQNRPARPSRKKIDFWLREARTALLLCELCRKYRRTAQRLANDRPALSWALKQDVPNVEQALHAEQEQLRAADRAYWQPLRDELFRLRQEHHRKPEGGSLSSR
jgi:hypothetical protein